MADNSLERPLKAFEFDSNDKQMDSVIASVNVPSQLSKTAGVSAKSSRKRPSRGGGSNGHEVLGDARELAKFVFSDDILLPHNQTAPPTPTPIEKKRKIKSAKTPAVDVAKTAAAKLATANKARPVPSTADSRHSYCGPSFENRPPAVAIPLPSFADNSRASSTAVSPRADPVGFQVPTDGQIAAAARSTVRQLQLFNFHDHQAAGNATGEASHQFQVKQQPLKLQYQQLEGQLLSAARGSLQTSTSPEIPPAKLAWLRRRRLFLIAPEGGLRLVPLEDDVAD